MNLHKSKIEWCTHTWNPVTGCKHGCEYCYARRMAARFAPHPCERPGIEPLEVLPKGSGCYYAEKPTQLYDETGERVRSTPYPKNFAPTYHAYRMDFPEKRKEPSRIFVSSMGDLFGEWVPDIWIEDVFDACKRAPQHTYLFLTKNPRRYVELASVGKLPAEKNFWYGASATDHQMAEASFRHLPAAWRGYNFFMSAEPLQGPINMGALEAYPKWLIIGGMTGPGSKNRQPRYEWAQDLAAWASARNIPVFMKDNLAPTWGDDLIQEYPEGMVQENGK